MNKILACIFDLDGVICDTAKYHYLAWKRLCETLKVNLSIDDNEKLKGLSRTQSLNKIIEMFNLTISNDLKEKLLIEKNKWYLEYLNNLNEDALLPGVVNTLAYLKNSNIKIALGSASKNANFILEKLNIKHFFDVIVDGNKVLYSKPHPQTYLLAAKELNTAPENCIVFEDAESGVQSAINANIKVIGIGDYSILKNAHMVIPSFENFDLTNIL